MALYFYFNETTGDLIYSDQATYSGSGYTSLGKQTNMNPNGSSSWIFNSVRSTIKTVSKDPAVVGKIVGLMKMTSMFSACSRLTNLDLSGFDTSAVTNMSIMFSGCSGLTNLDLSGFDTSAVTDMSSMFNGCSGLTNLDLSGFDTSAVTSMNNIFNNCSCLRLITISDKMSNVLSQLPAAQYYRAAGGEPVTKASLTAGTWVRDEADLSFVTSIVEQAQMSQAISRRIGKLGRDLRSTIDSVKPSVDIVRTTAHSTSYTKNTLEIVTDTSGKVTEMWFVTAD